MLHPLDFMKMQAEIQKVIENVNIYESSVFFPRFFSLSRFPAVIFFCPGSSGGGFMHLHSCFFSFFAMFIHTEALLAPGAYRKGVRELSHPQSFSDVDYFTQKMASASRAKKKMLLKFFLSNIIIFNIHI